MDEKEIFDYRRDRINRAQGNQPRPASSALVNTQEMTVVGQKREN